jgi:hypothetical protein
LASLAPALEVLFEAGRWYCGEVNAVGAAMVEEALPVGGSVPFVDFLGRVLPTLMQEPSGVAAVVGELERRMTRLLADPDPSTISARAVTAFADHRPGWAAAVRQSVDLQIAARDQEAVAAGEWLGVIGDVHPGAAPIIQGVFAHRAPDPDAPVAAWASDVGRRVTVLMPPWGPHLGVEARGIAVTPEDAIHIACRPGVRAQAPRRTWLPHELIVDGTDLIDRGGELCVPLVDAVFLPIFVSGVRAFELLPDIEHNPRQQIGNTVLRRAGWSVPAGDVPQRPQDVPAFARDRNTPRRRPPLATRSRRQRLRRGAPPRRSRSLEVELSRRVSRAG